MKNQRSNNTIVHDYHYNKSNEVKRSAERKIDHELVKLRNLCIPLMDCNPTGGKRKPVLGAAGGTETLPKSFPKTRNILASQNGLSLGSLTG